MIDGFRKDLVEKLGEESFKKVQNARIGIAGAGGLGSNCAMNLVRAGFRKLTIADFDTIQPSNLDRQFYFEDQLGQKKIGALKTNLGKINPDLDIETIDKKIERDNIKEIFRHCDAVVECFDTAESKSIFVSELLKTGKFIVTASGLGGIGSSDDIKVHRVKESLIVIGDLKSDIEHAPALSPRVSIAAAKQADVILEHVIKTGK